MSLPFSGVVHDARPATPLLQALLRFAIALALFTVGCTPVTDWRPSKTVVASRVEVPLSLSSGGLPFIAIPAADGSQPTDPRMATYAMIDIGAAGSAVSQRFVETRHLERRPEPNLEMRDAQWKASRSHWVVRIDEMNFGGVRIGDFDAVVDRSGTLGGPFDVVLGRPVFAEVLLTIDYPRRRVTFESGSLPEPNGKDVLPLKRDNRSNFLVPMTIDGREAWMILDTGVAGAGTPISAARSQQIKFANAPIDFGQTRSWFSTEKVRLGRVNGDFKLGQYTIRRPMVSVTNAQDDDYLGAAVLKHFAVTLDERSERIRFSLPADSSSLENVIETPPVRRLPFSLQPGQSLIQLDASGDGERAGLKTGDRLIAIDGLSIEQLTDRQFEELERRGEPMLIRVSRGGRALEYHVAMQTIVP